jgi:hypothetical protein
MTIVQLTVVLLASSAHAETKLIAIGSISGTYEDLAVETAAPLENGIPGNRLGGVGSSLTHAGGNLFLALPDRGPNAKPALLLARLARSDVPTQVVRVRWLRILSVSPAH